jgi:hypothetical protein
MSLEICGYHIKGGNGQAIALHFVSSELEIANNEQYPRNGCLVVYKRKFALTEA